MKSLDLFNMPCLWHMLQLSVLKAFNLRKVAKMLGRVRMIAAHFHRSALGMKQFCHPGKSTVFFVFVAASHSVHALYMYFMNYSICSNKQARIL